MFLKLVLAGRDKVASFPGGDYNMGGSEVPVRSIVSDSPYSIHVTIVKEDKPWQRF
jgi:hypothetical protein